MVVTSISGAVRYFSPIPFEDQWDGYIGFIHSLYDHDYRAWWTPQMEHRIVFSRVLFWLDYKIFGGLNLFSVITVFILMALLCAVLIRERWNKDLGQDRWFVVFVTVGLLFSWLQHENFTSGFQSQFIAVYLFAILGFAQYSRTDGKLGCLPVVIIWALLSVLSMANGLFVLPVIVIQGVLLRRPAREILGIFLVGVIAAAIYLHGQSLSILPVPPEMANVALAPVRFFFVFLGSPIAYLGGDNLATGIFGLVTFLTASGVVVRLYVTRSITPYRSFLIASYGFVVASGIGVAHGRWMNGFNSAHDSRYTTPALLGYLLLVMLSLDAFSKRRTAIMSASAVFLTCLLPIQLAATGHTSLLPYFVRSGIYDWNLAVLGPKIGLDHPEFDDKIFPLSAHDRYLKQTNFAASMEIGPYASGWLHDAGVVKYDPALRDDTACSGFLEHAGIDAIGRTAIGWVVARQYRQPSTLIVITDTNGITIGYGVTGMKRPDVAGQEGAPSDAGWYGFAKEGPGVLQAYAYVGGKFCRLPSV